MPKRNKNRIPRHVDWARLQFIHWSDENYNTISQKVGRLSQGMVYNKLQGYFFQASRFQLLLLNKKV